VKSIIEVNKQQLMNGKGEEKKKTPLRNRTPDLSQSGSTEHLNINRFSRSLRVFITVYENLIPVFGNRFKLFSDFVFLPFSFSSVFCFKTGTQTQCYSNKIDFAVLETENLFPKQVAKQALVFSGMFCLALVFSGEFQSMLMFPSEFSGMFKTDFCLPQDFSGFRRSFGWFGVSGVLARSVVSGIVSAGYWHCFYWCWPVLFIFSQL
jgi:hypothetical protein